MLKPSATPFDWHARIDATEAGQVLAAALAQGRVGARPALMFHSLDALAARIARLRAVFPPQTLHALAIKANPVVEVLRFAVERGMGLEAASLEEVALAHAAACPPERIVFDSPAKTRAEIAQALSSGVTLNADNFQELERIDAVLGSEQQPESLVGLRINPQIGEGGIGMLSVSGRYSKFGVPLQEQRSAIVAAFARYLWLRGLHVHTGSQGIGVAQMVEAVGRVFALREAIHARLGGKRIVSVDIGGGLPWPYRGGKELPTPTSYAAALAERVPEALADEVRLVTEFGRVMQAGCGFAVSRAEYLKTDGGRRTAVIHFGADLFMRKVYRPDDWHHPVSVLSPDGTPKQAPMEPHTIAGPLCFGGDILAEGIDLPRVEEGDWIVLHDAGGYTLGLWSRHCNRGLPKVLGYHADPWRFRVLLAGESPEDIVGFWSYPPV